MKWRKIILFTKTNMNTVTTNHRIVYFFAIALISCVRSLQISNVPVQKSFLRRSDPLSPWCYTVSLDSSYVDGASSNNNFLASQVWPAARVASQIIEKHASPDWCICELGCGPALPSLTAATTKKKALQSGYTKTNVNTKVIATDLDSFALELVASAASEQNLPLSTKIFDLTWKKTALLPHADLYIMSDVFESSTVACGAAFHAYSAIKKGSYVWVFAQNDRAQREIFLNEIQKLLNKNKDQGIQWSSTFEPCEGCQLLWLYDVDECKVKYN